MTFLVNSFGTVLNHNPLSNCTVSGQCAIFMESRSIYITVVSSDVFCKPLVVFQSKCRDSRCPKKGVTAASRQLSSFGVRPYKANQPASAALSNCEDSRADSHLIWSRGIMLLGRPIPSVSRKGSFNRQGPRSRQTNSI